MTRSYVNDIMSIKELSTGWKAVLFTESTIYGATVLRMLRNLEMKDMWHNNSYKVNYIYILTNAGMPSPPAAAGAFFMRAAQNACKQRGNQHADRPGQDPAVHIPKEQQPCQKADSEAASRDGKRGGQLFPCRMLCGQKATEKYRGKADAARGSWKLLLIDQPAEHKSRTKRGQGQQRDARDGKALQNGAKKASVPEF